jgi:SAM-dependent methyltransferase
LNSLDDGTQCQCGFKVSSLAGVPILRENEQNERLDYYSGGKLLPRMNSEHLNIPRIRNAFKRGDFMLELGAGVDICDNANLIKTDAFIYSPNLDYVVDAHSMPFADNTFDFVYSLAVFEHLHSPWVAAKEILRVLKPGGKVYILTAFMQHLHGYPHHYFNMTTMGLKRIFSEFEVIKCTPSPHCPLTQVGHIMDDLRVMTFALPNNENAQKLNIHLSAACSLIPIVQEDLIKEESNFDKWHMIAPGIELFAKKPLF